MCFFFFFQAEDGIRDFHVTGVQTCALPIWMLLRLIPFSAECDRDRDRLLGLDVYMHIPAVIARAVDTASVIVSGVELREFVAGAYPVENLVLCPARRRKQNQQPEQDRFSHKRPSRYLRTTRLAAQADSRLRCDVSNWKRAT